MDIRLGFKMSAAIILSFLSSSLLVAAQTDFAVTSADLYSWDQSDWSLTTKRFVPGQYQSRISLANGYAPFGLMGMIELTT
jgi:hypothetical protein